MNILGIVLICLLVLGVGIVLYYHFQKKPVVTKEEVYQGPVQEGYDEDYFRKTGISKPLEVKE